MSAVLEFDRVNFAYPGSDVSALTELSLSISEGESLALLGPNGAGKTTALRLAMALLHPVSGEVRVMGKATVGRMPEDVAGNAGFLFQQPEHQLFASSVREDVAFGPRQLGQDNIDEVVERALDQLELGDVASVHPYDLPAPRRRLVALAGVLALRPRLLLLDEPTAGLDRHSRLLVRRALAAHRAEGGAVVAVSHDGEFVLEALDRAVTLEHGRVVGDGGSAEALGRLGAPPAPAWARLVAQMGAAPAQWRFEPAVEFVAMRCRAAPDA